MSYYVDRVVICDAFEEPNAHYELQLDGTTKRREHRRPSMTIKGPASDLKGGVAKAKAKAGATPALIETPLFESEANPFINDLRAQLLAWREGGYRGTSRVTRRLLEWWFERPEERHNEQKRFFFCQQEAVEAVIYLYEVKNRQKMPETGELLRYALKLATGTGKTVVMAMVVTWSTLHKAKVSGSSLSDRFLVLVPNLTVLDRVSGASRGDGIVPNGESDLYEQMAIVPPDLRDAFRPTVLVLNWHAIPLSTDRDDWVQENQLSDQRFVPYSVAKALERRQRRDPLAGVRKLLKGWSDCLILNDEAHHAYGEKAAKKGEEPGYIRWNKVIDSVRAVTRLAAVVDLSATPWYGSGAAKPEGQLFEWVVTDFSVYDAFESGLVKVVRLPEPGTDGSIYLDLWDRVKDAKTRDEFMTAAGPALGAIYSAWLEDYTDWSTKFEMFRDAQPVLLMIAPDAKRAGWLFDSITSQFERLQNSAPDDVASHVTIQVNTQVFSADKGNEALLRQMVNTVGKRGAPGEQVRCIVSVNMLSEGWDVKSVSHIIGFRAFDSPLLTEQVIGRGLRRTDYSTLYEPLEERGDGAYETVDAFGVPFVGFPVQKTKKRVRKANPGETPVPVVAVKKKSKYRMLVPNVRSWAVGVNAPLTEVVDVAALRQIVIDPKTTPPTVEVSSPVGEDASKKISLDALRSEYPLTVIEMKLAAELLRRTTPDDVDVPGMGPTYEELLELVHAYVEERVSVEPGSDVRDLIIPNYWEDVLSTLHTAVENQPAGLRPVPMHDDPQEFDTGAVDFRWGGLRAAGKKTHLSYVACDSELEVNFADFLDQSDDVDKYVKNERLGFSVTYFEGGRPRQYYPDFIVESTESGSRRFTLVETKGELWPNTDLKRQAAEQWCSLMTQADQGDWTYLFVHEPVFRKALKGGISSISDLRQRLREKPKLTIVPMEAVEPAAQFDEFLPLYSLKAAAGYFGDGEEVEREGWVRCEGRLDKAMFVARVVGRSMEPRIPDGGLCVFRANPAGSRQNKIVLAQHHAIDDPDTGGSYTVKRYHSEKVIDPETGDLVNAVVRLEPINAEFEVIVLEPEFEADVSVIAELVSVLPEA